MNQYSPIVICDCDDVLNNLVDATLDWVRKEKGFEIQKESLVQYDLSKVLLADEWKAIEVAWMQGDLWKSLIPLPNAQEGLRKIHESGCRVYIATATDMSNAPIKLRWMQQHFPFIPQEHFMVVHHKWLLTPRADFVIDDKLETLLECSQATYRICVDNPWNRRSKDYDEVHGIHRVKDLVEAHDKIRELLDKEES